MTPSGGSSPAALPRAQGDGGDLLRWERWTHLDPEHALNNALQHVSVVAIPACYFYATLALHRDPRGIDLDRTRPVRRSYRNARTVLAVVTASALLGF